MRILLPYKKFSDVSIYDEKIPGGLEKFAKLVYQNIPNVIPIEFTEVEQKRRQVTNLVACAARREKVDVILSNYDNDPLSIKLQEQVDIPVFLIGHVLALTVFKLKVLSMIPKFKQNGGTLALVSKYQLDTWKRMSGKVNKDFVLEPDGFVCPSFCLGNEVLTSERKNDVIVVSRADITKDPFSVIRKIEAFKEKNGYKPFNATIVTTKYRLEKNSEYLKENSHWEDKGYKILWDLPHDKVLEEISKSSVLVSTCPDESFGITTLEALSHGIPVILFTNANMKHASLDIGAGDGHILPLNKRCKPAEFVEAVQMMRYMPQSFNGEIFGMTQEKHSKERWTKNILDLCEKAVYNYFIMRNKSTLESFL